MTKIQVNSQGKAYLTTTGKALVSIQPTLVTKSITENGTYNASSDNADGYSSVTVNVSGGGGSKYGCTVDNFLGDVDANGVLQQPAGTTGDIVFNGVKDVAAGALSYRFYNNTKLTHGVSFPDLEKVSGINGCYYMFDGCTFLTSASFPRLTTISGDYGCYGMFYKCSSLVSVSFPNLTAVGNGGCYYIFYGCRGLTSVSFPNLTTVSGSTAFTRSFASCTNIEDIYFPALTTSSFVGLFNNQFNFMMSDTGTAKTHTIHFPSNLESTISTLTGYPLFGGTAGYVTLAFDLSETS